MIDLPSYEREAQEVQERLRHEARLGDGLVAERRRQDLRLEWEAKILEAEMEADARQDASVQAAFVMRDMREQLLGLVEQQEQLLKEEEEHLDEETDAAVVQLRAAREDSMLKLEVERDFYPNEAPKLQALMEAEAERGRDEVMREMQGGNLTLLQGYKEGGIMLLQLLEKRLHQVGGALSGYGGAGGRV